MTWYKTWETKINTPNTAYSRTVANGIQHWAVRGHQEATIRAFQAEAPNSPTSKRDLKTKWMEHTLDHEQSASTTESLQT